MRNPYPFYIEREERTSFSQSLRDLADAIKIMEELKKADKPKEEKKEEKKPSAFKTWLLLCIGSFAMFPIFVWVWFAITMDIIQKAKHLPLQ